MDGGSKEQDPKKLGDLCRLKSHSYNRYLYPSSSTVRLYTEGVDQKQYSDCNDDVKKLIFFQFFKRDKNGNHHTYKPKKVRDDLLSEKV